MKKISTLITLMLILLTGFTNAQSPCNADFTTVYQNGNTIQFIPAFPGSPNSTFHQWIFGDGTNSNLTAPTHTYTSGTVFTVMHIVREYGNGALICSDSTEKVVQVQNSTCNLVANFYTIRDTTNSVPFTYYFVNTSTPLNATDSVRWTFGDGSSSNDFNPTHTYAQPGTYNVCIRVKKVTLAGIPPCVREICHQLVVQNPTTCNLQASFQVTPINASNNSFHFQNTSVPLNSSDSIRWTFGDGTSSNDLHANHTYAQTGTYTVCLRVIKRNATGGLTNCADDYCSTITVAPTPCNLIANFTFRRDTTTLSTYTYKFHNTSTPLNNSDSIRWTFGDGSSSNDQSPSHTYNQPGSYVVCLRVIQRTPNGGLTNCIREKCMTIYVQAPNPCPLSANFYYYRITSTAVPFTYHFQNTSAPVSATDSIRWTFGDGTSSNQLHPNHAFLQPGTYQVCLRIQKRDTAGILLPCVKEKCIVLTIYPSTNTGCNLTPNFYFAKDTLATIPNTYKFFNTSIALNSTDSVRWTFGDGTSSNDLNPTHSYLQNGVYTVCLRVQKRDSTGLLTNCVRQKCMTVYVGPYTSPATCSLQLYPNPVTNYVNFNLHLQQPLMINVYVYNSTNSLVMQKQQYGYAGYNTISMVTAQLISGIYRIRVVYGNSVCYGQFVKY